MIALFVAISVLMPTASFAKENEISKITTPTKTEVNKPLPLGAAGPNWFPDKISLSATYNDGYLATRISRLLTTEPSIWYQMNMKWKSGLYFSWLEIHGVDDTDWSSGPADETQVTVGHEWKIGNFDLKTEATLINIHPIEDWFNHDRLSLDLYLSRTFKFDWNGSHLLTPEIRTIWFADTNFIGKGVPVIMPSITHKWNNPLGVGHSAIQTKATLAWDGGLYKNDAQGIFFHLDSGLQWKTGNLTVTLPGIKLISPLTQTDDGRDKSHNLFYCGVKYDF